MADSKKTFNPPARVALYCWITALIGAGVFLYPLTVEIETYGLGFSLNFVGIIILLSGLISGVVFRRLATYLDALVSGRGLLAHWTYGAEEWSRYTEGEHVRDRREKWALFRLVAIIAAVVGVIFSVVVRDSWLITLVVISALILLIAGVASLSIALTYRQNRAHLGEVYVGKSGALVGRTFHFWKLPASLLDSVVLQEGDRPVIELVYSAQSGVARGQYTARFPIPLGREAEAEELLRKLSGKESDEGPGLAR